MSWVELSWAELMLMNEMSKQDSKERWKGKKKGKLLKGRVGYCWSFKLKSVVIWNSCNQVCMYVCKVVVVVVVVVVKKQI